MIVNYIDNSSDRVMKTSVEESLNDYVLNLTTDNVRKASNIIKTIRNTLAELPIFWSDNRFFHYSYDTKLDNGKWLESIYWSNDMKEVKCSIFFEEV